VPTSACDSSFWFVMGNEVLMANQDSHRRAAPAHDPISSCRSATISSVSSATTTDPSEMRSGSIYLSHGGPAHPVSGSVDYMSLFMLQR